jgi:hypothetical protein
LPNVVFSFSDLKYAAIEVDLLLWRGVKTTFLRFAGFVKYSGGASSFARQNLSVLAH